MSASELLVPVQFLHNVYALDQTLGLLAEFDILPKGYEDLYRTWTYDCISDAESCLGLVVMVCSNLFIFALVSKGMEMISPCLTDDNL